MRQLVLIWFKDDDALENIDRHKIDDVLLERGVVGSVPEDAMSFIVRYEDVPDGSETDARQRGIGTTYSEKEGAK